MLPKVFIGIPTLNRPKMVVETIKSVREQTWQPSRIIVSDNGSETKATATVNEYIRTLQDDKIFFHQQERNVGEYGQGWFFLENATDHDYFMILHDDDLLTPHYLEKGVALLEENPSMACFVANPFLLDDKGDVSQKNTEKYLADHGRKQAEPGPIDILTTHLAKGFTPISGTLFRLSALRKSGFVDVDCYGLYPFECNVFLRLGDVGAKAWFCPEKLIGFRFHTNSMRNYLNMMENSHVVETMIRLFAKRQYGGENEKRRKYLLCRLYCARALIRLRSNRTDFRSDIVQALQENPLSPRAWAIAPLLIFLSSIVKYFMPKLPEQSDQPFFKPNSVFADSGSSS